MSQSTPPNRWGDLPYDARMGIEVWLQRRIPEPLGVILIGVGAEGVDLQWFGVADLDREQLIALVADVAQRLIAGQGVER